MTGCTAASSNSQSLQQEILTAPSVLGGLGEKILGRHTDQDGMTTARL